MDVRNRSPNHAIRAQDVPLFRDSVYPKSAPKNLGEGLQVVRLSVRGQGRVHRRTQPKSETRNKGARCALIQGFGGASARKREPYFGDEWTKCMGRNNFFRLNQIYRYNL